MRIKKSICKGFWQGAFPLILGIFLVFPLFADMEEVLIKISDEPNYTYEKPEVKISPDGGIYVAFQAIANATQASEVYLSKYADGTVSMVKNISESGSYSYEADIDIPGNGYIHAVWVEKSGNTHTIRYRYFNGTAWSASQSFGQVSGDLVEDLRLDVDEAGNVFVVFMYWPAARCKFVSKYGNSVSFEDWPLAGRTKHGDVEADANFVHVCCQYADGNEYTIAYNRRANRKGSSWDPWINLNHSDTQRPRLSLDNTGRPHIIYNKKASASTRDIFCKRWNGSRFDTAVKVSNPDPETYHFTDIEALDPDNVIVSMQKGAGDMGRNVSYNLKLNGTWTGFTFFETSDRKEVGRQSIDLVPDGIACAFTSNKDTVYLTLVGEGGIEPPPPVNVPPTAVFTFSPVNGVIPLDVTFNASKSTDPDGTIAKYQWSFGDGASGSGKIVTHTYRNPGIYNIMLTVTDDQGATASASGKVETWPVLGPVNIAWTTIENRSLFMCEYISKITWDKNLTNVARNINVTRYKIYRKKTTEYYYVYLTMVDAQDHNEHLDRYGTSSTNYDYTVVSVDDHGRESALPSSIDLYYRAANRQSSTVDRE